MPGPQLTVRENARHMTEQNPRQLALVEEIVRKILPMVLVKATLRKARPENNVRKMHYRGPMGIHLILTANHGEETGRSFIELRRGKEWLVMFSCLPDYDYFGPLERAVHVNTAGDTFLHNPSKPVHLPFYSDSSAILAMKRDNNGRGKILPTYINLAYWMTEFGTVAFIEQVVNIDAAERDVIALLVERN